MQSYFIALVSGTRLEKNPKNRNIVWSKSKHKMTNDVLTKQSFNKKIAMSIFNKMNNANSLPFELE